jgi:hypothetical protein
MGGFRRCEKLEAFSTRSHGGMGEWAILRTKDVFETIWLAGVLYSLGEEGVLKRYFQPGGKVRYQRQDFLYYRMELGNNQIDLFAPSETVHMLIIIAHTWCKHFAFIRQYFA